MRFFLFLFIAIPLVEIYVLISVGQRIGGLQTIGLILATAVIGVAMLRQQGLKAMVSAQTKMRQGALPAKELVDGVFLAVGGVLLLTPGFVTDGFGFCCLIPGIRRGLVAVLGRRFRVVKGASQWRQRADAAVDDKSAPASDKRQNSGRTFEGQYHRDE